MTSIPQPNRTHGTHDLESEVESELERTMIRDRHRLRTRWEQLRHSRRAGHAHTNDLERRLDAFVAEVRASVSRRERRAEEAPRPTYPAELPIVLHKDKIAQAIDTHQVVVICGETGSGKTTQLPKICLELGRGVAGMIGHTQPRRVAARTLAARIASELDTSVGGAVGYKVRFTDRVRENTYLKLMTDGILLAETQHDRRLEQYDTIIIDEAHERSLNIDFLLGYLKQLLAKRPDLKVIVTSATIDPERFSRHFDDAPIIQVSGRVYPVEVRYRPLSADRRDPAAGEGGEVLGVGGRSGDGGNADDDGDRDPLQGIEDAVAELSRLGPGDILVFLPGERDIREAAEYLRKSDRVTANVLPLYGRLSSADQARVFEPHSEQRVVLATNVAETSLTVPGVQYVVDTGLARISRYDPRRKVQRLPIERVARASADQRRGRCGRTAAGVCIRLYSEEDYLSRAEFTSPEIQRTNLAAVILKMASLGLGDLDRFPFVEPPDPRAVRDGYHTLLELGAIDERAELTSLGRRLARLPTDPRIGRIILAAEDHACLAEILVIAAALEVQDPRQRPFETQARADAAHRAFLDETSDFLSYLKIWRAFHEEAKARTKNQLRKWCEERFLSFWRMREWVDVHDQLSEVVAEMELKPGSEPGSSAAIHKALLTGLLGNVGMKSDDKTYLGARNTRLFVFPGSGLAKKHPEWIVAGEIVETERLYARTVARIDPAWIEPLADHVVGRTHSEPHWDKSRGQVLAYERVTLFGLPLTKRKIDFGRIDPDTAHEIFLTSALVEGELRTTGSFLRHNSDLVGEVQALQERMRRRDLLVDDERIRAIYARIVPNHIHTQASFEKWRKQAEAADPQVLWFEKSDLFASDPDEDLGKRFPDAVVVGSSRLALSYRFAPGDDDDGVTALVPLPVLHRIDSERIEWLVPGLLSDKVAAYFESLPRNIRRSLEPVREHAEACARELCPGSAGGEASGAGGEASGAGGSAGRDLRTALAEWVSQRTGSKVPPDSLRPDSCPEHLHMRLCVVDETGSVLATGRDLRRLQTALAPRARQAFDAAVRPHERGKVVRWDVGKLDSRVDVKYGPDLLFVAFPALDDRAGEVVLRLFDSRESADRAHRSGVRRLLSIRLSDVVKQVSKSLSFLKTAALRLSQLATSHQVIDEVIGAAVERACLSDRELPRDESSFERCLSQGRGRVAQEAAALSRTVEPISTEYHDIMTSIAQRHGPVSVKVIEAIRDHVQTLVYRGFLTDTPAGRLAHLPRYLKAARLRLERLRLDPARDAARAQQVDPLWQAYRSRAESHRIRDLADPELERYRWMLEEWRVSIFAQELKTAEPVSAKRLEEQWARVRA